MKKLIESLKSFFSALPTPVIRFGILLVLFLILVIFAWNPIRVSSLQARAGKRIDTYLQNNASSYVNFFTCQIPALTRLPADESLENSLFLLEKAAYIRPKSAQTYLLLGKVDCLKEDFSSALVAFDRYGTLSQGNPLGELESAFAHYTASLVTQGLSDAERAAHETACRQIFEAQGYSYEYFLDEGNAAFERDAHAAAWYWYRLAGLFQPLAEEAAQRLDFLDALFID